MTDFINPGNVLFRMSRASEWYVDKSMLLAFTNRKLGTEGRFLCITRPRRSGKSMAANMVAAYYDESCDSQALFHGLAMEKDPGFATHLNKYPVIKIDMGGFLSELVDHKNATAKLDGMLSEELRETFRVSPLPQNPSARKTAATIRTIYARTGKPFVLVIDEWDAMFREFPDDTEEQDAYLEFLRSLCKNDTMRDSVALCYLTGILPIKRYRTQSALNNFDEYTMLDPGELAPFVGFTEPEVRQLCALRGMDFEELKRWYDGYEFQGQSIYNPFSVVRALSRGSCANYWSDTSSFEDAKFYINLGLQGLRDDVTALVAGERRKVNVTKFGNTLTDLGGKDEVLTLLIHLGYLAYDRESKSAYVPNLEVSQRLADSVADSGWGYVSEALAKSEDLLEATLAGKEDEVARIIASVHGDASSVLTYNRENDLALVVMLAYQSARAWYLVRREQPAGDGYADVAFIPRPGCRKPPLLVELKWGKAPRKGMAQIQEKNYASLFRGYGEAVLCAIAYDPRTKRHACTIKPARF